VELVEGEDLTQYLQRHGGSSAASAFGSSRYATLRVFGILVANRPTRGQDEIARFSASRKGVRRGSGGP
jgi:hypothetical protein